VIDSFRPILRDLLHVRADRLELGDHFRHPVLDLRVVSHGAGDREGGLLLQRLDDEVDRPLREPVIDVREPEKSPRETGA
jgi:hypothetical protein